MKLTTIKNRSLLSLPWEYDIEDNILKANVETAYFHGPELTCQETPAGSSFRLILWFRFTSFFYSGRDRAGKEKKKGDDKDKTPMNHICRDWVSGIPIVKAGAWKRLFRRLYPDKEMIEEIFGEELDQERPEDHRGDGAEGLKGELKFHHAFVDELPGMKAGRYIITPRKEAHGIADVPIEFEVVMPCSGCRLVIDYIPREFDCKRASKILNDLIQAAKIVQEDAIGAKTSTGSFGKIRLERAEIMPSDALREILGAETR